MSHHPHDGSAEDRLGMSLLRFIEEGRTTELRQALSGFNHRCRNTLNSIRIGFYLTRRSATGPLPDRWHELNGTYLEVEKLFDSMQSIYRTITLTMVHQPLRAIIEERGRDWRAMFDREGATLAIRPPTLEASGAFDAMRIASAFDAFVAWRGSRLGPGGRATLTWATTRRHFEVSWNEVAPAAAIVRPAAPLCPVAALASTTRSLGLPLLASVIAEHRGRLSWSPGPAAEARIRWPLTPSPAAATASPLASTLA